MANIGFAGEPTAQLNSQVGGAELQGGGKGETVKSKSKVNEWKSVGQLVSKLQDLYSAVRDTFVEMGIGTEIIPWLASEGRISLVGKLKELGNDFLVTQAVPEPPKPKPTIIELGEFRVGYDETIAAKLAAITDAGCIGYRTSLAADKNFPDARTGKKKYKASAVHFGQSMAQDAIERWCAENKKILALPKDGIDIARVSPRPELDDVMPLAMAGQFFVGVHGRRRALFFGHGVSRRGLYDVWLGPSEQGRDAWWFLVLEELPLVA